MRLPYRLYAGDPHWVPPLRLDERRRWSPAHNPSLRDRWVRRFIAYRDGEPVGRVAVIEDREFARTWDAGTGWFGFFECVDDSEAARALLDAAEGALRQRGLGAVIGPVNLTTHDETGVLVRGFDTPASLMTPYNPPYYEGLFAAAGYTPTREYHAYRARLDGELSPGLGRVARAAAAGRGVVRGVRIRPLDLRRWQEEARIVWSLYNRAFSTVWGFVPIAWEEFLPRAERFRQFAVPDLVPIAERDGEPVGFALVLPDINIALSRAGGRLFPLGWLRLALAVPRIRAFRFILLGVCPEYRGAAIGALIALYVRDTANRLGIEHLELSLVQGLNQPVRQVIDAFDCPIAKTFRLYRKSLDPGQGAAGEAAR